MRVRNVKLHQGGETVKGTLCLEQFHLTFTYAPEEPKPAVAAQQIATHSPTPSLSAQTSTASHASVESNGASTPKASMDGERKSKPRTKTLWIAYPTINKCVLRPSHLRTHQHPHAPASSESRQARFDGSDDGFPPTYGTGYGRPSTDSARLAPYSSPQRSLSPAPGSSQDEASFDSGRSPALRIRCRDFRMLAFHFHGSAADSKSADEVAREVFFALRGRCCVEKIEKMLAFQFRPPAEEKAAEPLPYDARREFARQGIGEKAPDGPGRAWRITDINAEYEYSPTYPSVLCVPKAVSDNLLKYGGEFRSKQRIPALSYLHFNGGSITRSSQPRVGVQGKRNVQDERLVSAIFTSHTPAIPTPTDSPPVTPTRQEAPALDTGDQIATAAKAESVDLRSSRSESALTQKADLVNGSPPAAKVFGSQRHNAIVDARPRLNALANRATGGGIEDLSNYTGAGDVPVDRIFLDIPNIHVMRNSLDKVIESFGNADYVQLPPNHDLLRKSGWLGHIAGLISGAELVARRVGLAGSHVLVHCSDGWDRTSQVAALAQIMLDPHTRTLNGFITLIQKDFLSFGHKFHDRTGIRGSERWFEIENERVAPTRSSDESSGSQASGALNAFSSKALTGAKNWFEKNRGSLFRQPNTSQDNLPEGPSSRPASPPPPNPLIHSAANGKDEKESTKTATDEISPIFHQFLESVWNLQTQYPTAFEYNERFLIRLLYQVYAGQYAEFLFNTERERVQAMQEKKLPSVWGHFLARRQEFVNAEYNAREWDSLILPKHEPTTGLPKVRWWAKLFGRKDEEMNLPTVSLASVTAQTSSLSVDEKGDRSEEAAGGPPRQAKSTPDLSAMPGAEHAAAAAPPDIPKQNPIDLPVAEQAERARPELVAAPAVSEPCVKSADEPTSQPAPAHDDFGDPLGVSRAPVQAAASHRLDFAAFAQQNAFRD